MMYLMKAKGFTLIELLVVISIIGLLSSVVMASLNSARDKARYAAVAQGLRQADIAFTALFNERGCWPREGSTACQGFASGNPTVDALLGNAPFGLKQHLPQSPSWPFSASVWQYDNDGDSIPTDCSTYSVNGVKLFIENTVTTEQYRALNTLIDGDPNPDTNAARGCGKIQFSTTGSPGTLTYVLSPTQ